MRGARPSRFATLAAAIAAEFGDVALSVPRSDEEWRALLAAADWHRLAPVLARQLDGAPEWVRERLAETQMQDTVRSLRFGHARAEVLAALARDGIPVIPLKGSALVETVYPTRRGGT